MKYIYIYTHTHTTDKTALEIVIQKLEELVKKEPTTPSASIDPWLAVLDIHTASNSSSRTSSENEKEIEQLEDQFRGLKVKRLHHPTQTNLTKNWYPRPTPPTSNSRKGMLATNSLYPLVNSMNGT